MNEQEKYLRKNIGKKIKLARSKTKYTQESLAEYLELSARYISQLERGIAFGSATTIVNLCNALNISPDFLFHDLVKAGASDPVTFIFDDDFLQNYYQLNDNNKELIHAFADDMIKLQNKNIAKKLG